MACRNAGRLGSARSKRNREAVNNGSTGDDPLVVLWSAAYPEEAMRRPSLSHRSFAIVSLAVVVISAIGAFLAVRQYDDLLFEAFRDRSIAYVQAFVSSTRPWIDPLHPEMLVAASRMLLVGSALYVELLVEGETVVQEWVNEPIPRETMDPSPLLGVTADRRDLALGGWVLDVTVPLPAPSVDMVGGYGRVGIDSSAVRTQARNTALLAAAVTLLFDLLILGAIRWGLRDSQSSSVVKEESGPEPRAPMIAGPLCIDADQKTITLSGDPVSLTPKQFSLLAFLAENMDRVCSDREILAAVWADSPYADSKDVKQYIYLVRRRLAKVDPNERNRIQTVPGFGYKLVSAVVDPPLTED